MASSVGATGSEAAKVVSRGEHAPTGVVDGRRARGERTAERITAALLALYGAGNRRPSLQQVANESGVALRTIYHHFVDADTLRVAALDLAIERSPAPYPSVDPATPRATRASALVRARAQFYEAITPALRAVLAVEAQRPELSPRLHTLHREARRHLEVVFDEELPPVTPERKHALDQLDVVSSWINWSYLRAELGRSVRQASEVVTFSLLRILDQQRGSGSEPANAPNLDKNGQLSPSRRANRSPSANRPRGRAATVRH